MPGFINSTNESFRVDYNDALKILSSTMQTIARRDLATDVRLDLEKGCIAIQNSQYIAIEKVKDIFKNLFFGGWVPSVENSRDTAQNIIVQITPESKTTQEYVSDAFPLMRSKYVGIVKDASKKTFCHKMLKTKSFESRQISKNAFVNDLYQQRTQKVADMRDLSKCLEKVSLKHDSTE